MVKSNSRVGGSLGSASGNTSAYSQTVRGDLNSIRSSSPNVRLANHPVRLSCHRDRVFDSDKDSCISKRFVRNGIMEAKTITGCINSKCSMST
jgi:hypothetical protein